MPKKKRRKSQAQRFFSGLLYIFFLFSVLLLGSAAGWFSKSNVFRAGLLHLSEPPEQMFHQNTLNVLVLGCDEDRATGGKKILKSGVRSDMMLLTRLDFKNNRITGVSIPRDTLCDLTGYKRQKINAFHALGGKPLAKRAVEALLPVTVDRVVDLDFDEFEKLVDMVGGVPITVPKNMKYTDRAGGLYINLKKGPQTLNGYDAMGFVRFRHSDSDFARQERQHQFVIALKGVLQKKWQKLPQVADQAAKVAGDEFSEAEAFKLAQFAKGVKEKDIRLGSIPVTEVPRSSNLELDEDRALETLREFSFLPPLKQASVTE